jgi:3',5'-cyclic AMP phosphodiesterase CpdA
MRVIHITDPHLTSLEGRSLGASLGKRNSGYLSWKLGRRSIYRRETLECLTTAIRAEAADQLILSGDLVHIGLEAEIDEVGKWLAELAPAEQIFFVPGNHDVYARDSWEALRRHWHFVLPAPVRGVHDSSTSAYPHIRDLGMVRLIGVSSACVTPVFSARGSLGQEQTDRLDVLLREAREQGRMPCIAIHHPPLPHMSPWRRALKENHALKAIISVRQPALVWYGHQHVNVNHKVDKTRIFCTAPASAVENASYRIFDIDPIDQGEGQSWSIHMRLKSIAADGLSFSLAEAKRWTFTL